MCLYFLRFLLYCLNNVATTTVYSVLSQCVSRSCSFLVVAAVAIAFVVAIANPEQLEFPFVASLSTCVAAVCLLLSLVTFIGVTLIMYQASHFTTVLSLPFVLQCRIDCLISTDFSSLKS